MDRFARLIYDKFMFSICSHSFLSMSTKTIPECLMLNVLIRPECASILFDISSTQILQSCNRTSFSGYNSNNCVFSARIRTRCRPEIKTESSEHHFSWPQIKKRIQASEKCLVSSLGQSSLIAKIPRTLILLQSLY